VSSTEAITTTGAELNNVELTAAATASGPLPARTVVQSLGSRTPAELPPPPPEPGLAPWLPAEQAANSISAALPAATERRTAIRRARAQAPTEQLPALVILCDHATVRRVLMQATRRYWTRCQDCVVSDRFPTPRKAASADIPDLLALIQSAYRGESSRAGWTTEADLLDGQRIDAEMLSAQIADPANTVLLLGDSTGALACAMVTDRSVGVAYFGMFAVRPTAQGSGIGSWLLSEAEDLARQLGADRMQMTVLSLRPELLAWYARRGYLPTGRTIPFPHGDERFGLPRRPDLEFTELEAKLPSR
jgi:GNAT superfamily N-acetyltransferase